MRLKEHLIYEAAYKGNIGFEEMVKFYQEASKDQKKKMEEIIEKGDWDKFTNLIKKVLGTKLKK